MAESDAGFQIGGVVYPFPTLDSLDLDEAELLYLASGWGIEDFVIDPDDANVGEVAKRLIRASTLKALATIAYRRAHPDVDEAFAAALAGKANAMGALTALMTRGDDADPPSEAPTNGATPSSNEIASSENVSSDSPNAISGNASETNSAEQDDDQLTTSTPASHTSRGTHAPQPVR